MAGASPLTTEQGLSIDERIVKKARQTLKGRQLMHTFGPVGFGAENFAFDYLTEMSAGHIDVIWGRFTEDIPGLTRTTLPVPVLHKEFRIGRRQLAASKMTGAPLDTTSIDAATYQVCLKEDDLIVQGKTDDSGTSYTISGLYAGAGNGPEVTADDFGTEANVYAKLALCEALLQADNIFPPYNLGLATTQYNQLLSHCASTAVPIKDAVERRIGGKVFMLPDLTDGSGLLLATADQDFFDLIIGVDMTHEETELEKSKDCWGIVYECVVPRLKDSNAICSFTGA